VYGFGLVYGVSVNGPPPENLIFCVDFYVVDIFLVFFTLIF